MDISIANYYASVDNKQTIAKKKLKDNDFRHYFNHPVLKTSTCNISGVHQIYFKELCNVIVYKCNLDVSTFQITKNQLT
jgi:hypothetical protein